MHSWYNQKGNLMLCFTKKNGGVGLIASLQNVTLKKILWAINLTLVNFLKFEIISSIFSNYNVVRLDVNYRGKKTIKIQTYGGKITYFWITKKITEEIKK